MAMGAQAGPLSRQRPPEAPTSQPPSPREGGKPTPAPKAPLTQALLLPRDEGSRATVGEVRATRNFGESKTLRRLSSEPVVAKRVSQEAAPTVLRARAAAGEEPGVRRFRKGERGGA